MSNSYDILTVYKITISHLAKGLVRSRVIDLSPKEDTLSSRIITKLPQTGLRIKVSTFVYTLKNKLFEDVSILGA